MAKNKKFLPKISDNVKSYFVIWWFSGAVYFFIAWGTGAGLSEDPIDLIFALGLGMGIVTLLLINPIIYNLFTIRRGGKIANKKFHERNVFEGTAYILLEIIKASFITVLIFLSYQIINQTIIRLWSLDSNQVIIPGEPILFASLYVLFLSLINGISDKIHNILKKEES